MKVHMHWKGLVTTQVQSPYTEGFSSSSQKLVAYIYIYMYTYVTLGVLVQHVGCFHSVTHEKQPILILAKYKILFLDL